MQHQQFGRNNKSSLNFFSPRNALGLSSRHSQVIKARTTFTVSPEQGNTIRKSLFIQAHVDFIGGCLTFVCFSPAVQRWCVCVSWDACKPNLHTLCLGGCVVSAQAQQITAQSFLFHYLMKLLNLLRSHHPPPTEQLLSSQWHRCCQTGAEDLSQQISELAPSQQRPQAWFR